MADPIFLRQNLAHDALLEGKISGVAYSGALLGSYGYWENFIVDVATLTIAKPKTPILRDHMPSQVAGHASVTIDGFTVNIEGKLSKKSSYGADIIALAEDGMEWEQSIGVFDGTVEEVTNTEVNGIMIEHGFVLRNAVLRETSVVALGADQNTNVNILSQNKGESKFMITMTKEQWTKFACGCGGHKDSTPEELEATVKSTKLASEEDKAKIDSLTKEVDDLKAAIAAKEAEIAAIKDAEAEEENSASLSKALAAKNITFSADKIKEAAKTKAGTDALLSLISGMEIQAPVKKTIEAKLTGLTNLGEASLKNASEADAITLAANALVSEGKAKNFIEAVQMAASKGA